MKIWKVHFKDGHDCAESQGFTFCDSYTEAKAVKKEHEIDLGWAEIETIEFNCNKRGIISLLTLHASHPDNG